MGEDRSRTPSVPQTPAAAAPSAAGDDLLLIGGRRFSSRLMTGTGKYPSLAAMRATVFSADPMAPVPPIEPMIQASSDPGAPVNASPGADRSELSDFIEISGLLRYDPAAITRIYAGHPQRLVRRLWQTLVPIALYLMGVGSDRLLGRLRGERVRERSREAATLVASLGPAFIKAGQALSTRPDIIPPVLLEELALSQSDAGSWLGLHLRRVDAFTDAGERRRFEMTANARTALACSCGSIGPRISKAASISPARSAVSTAGVPL